MPNKPVEPFKPYWDACIFISSIERTPGRIEVIDAMKALAKNARLLVVTSSIVMGEIIKWDGREVMEVDEEMKKIRDYLENPWITRRVADNSVSEKAGHLRRRFGLKLPDALHLATAWRYEVDQFQTYDQGLIKIDGELSFEKKAGKLRICEPEIPDKEHPLFRDQII